MKRPLISVITVTYNAGRVIEQSIQSVLKQDRNLFEYIIIDGGSTDDTLVYIEKYGHEFSYHVSETDSGIYDAMNKGIDASNGEWIFFLGADDTLMADALYEISLSLENEFDLIYGNICFDTGKKFFSDINVKILFHNTVHHQSAFYNRRLFDGFRYDNSMKIMSDYELNLIVYLCGKNFKKVNNFITNCNRDGASSDVSLSLEETNYIRGKHLGKLQNLILSYILKLKYKLHYTFIKV